MNKQNAETQSMHPRRRNNKFPNVRRVNTTYTSSAVTRDPFATTNVNDKGASPVTPVTPVTPFVTPVTPATPVAAVVRALPPPPMPQIPTAPTTTNSAPAPITSIVGTVVEPTSLYINDVLHSTLLPGCDKLVLEYPMKQIENDVYMRARLVDRITGEITYGSLHVFTLTDPPFRPVRFTSL